MPFKAINNGLVCGESPRLSFVIQSLCFVFVVSCKHHVPVPALGGMGDESNALSGGGDEPEV